MGSSLCSNPGVSEGAAFPLSPGHYAAARKETALMEADSARLGGVGGGRRNDSGIWVCKDSSFEVGTFLNSGTLAYFI